MPASRCSTTPCRPATGGRSAVLRDLRAAGLDPGGSGTRAWRAFLRAHASLMRQLELELETEADLPLADFDVLIQLALAGGALRMTELADRALLSRSGMTRRVARLVDEALVERGSDPADRRGIVVELTAGGRARLREAIPLHARGVARHFASRLDDDELGMLERALRKVTIECSFG